MDAVIAEREKVTKPQRVAHTPKAQYEPMSSTSDVSSTLRRPRLLGLVKGRMLLWEWHRQAIICRACDKL